MDRRQWRAVVLAMAVLGGCSSGDNDEQASSSTTTAELSTTTAELGPVVKGEAKIEGAVTASGPFDVVFPRTDQRLNSCEKIATGATGAYLIPLPVRLGSQQFVWEAFISRYKGPGMYLRTDLGTLAVQVSNDAGTDPVKFVPGPATTASVEVKPDNSGAVSFANLVAGEQQLSGTASWTCAG